MCYMYKKILTQKLKFSNMENYKMIFQVVHEIFHLLRNKSNFL